MATPLIAVVGETASGKTDLALRLAKQFKGEVICADSSTVRRKLDIGSAKPAADERALVPHHLLDIIDPCERFTVAKFKQLAEEAIADITSRGNVPIMAGGSGLYIDSVVYGYNFVSKSDQTDRKKLRSTTLLLGIKPERELLKSNITQRVDAQLAAGLEAEVLALVERYGWDCPGLKNIAYAQWRGYFEGSETLADTRQKIIKANLDLAKRQRTWFKRNKSIQWQTTPVNWTNVVGIVTTFLQK